MVTIYDKGIIKIAFSLCLILAIVFITFIPSLKNGFVNWDDDIYVTGNPLIRDSSFKGIIKIFTTLLRGIYKPIALLSFAIEYRFFKLNPAIYHTTNLILHLINCLLVFLFIFVFDGNLRISFIVTFLFGVHPLHVESVAWITERKDMLYSLFFLSSLISYLYYLKKGKGIKYYYFSLFLFILSLLVKPMGLFLPFVVLLCDYSLGVKYNKANIIKKIPFFVIALVIFAVDWHTLKGSFSYDPALNLLDKILIANYGLVFYIYKLFMPVGLSCLYPYPLKTKSLLPGVFLYSAIIVIILSVIVILISRRTKKVLFGALFYFFTVLPVLQLVPYGPTIVADRYAYISSIGVIYIAAVIINWIYNSILRQKITKFVFLTFMIFISAILISLTWSRCKVWKDSLTLWNDAISKHPGKYIPIAYFNRGTVYTDKGDDQKAILDFDQALTLYYRKLGINQDYVRIYNKILTDRNGYAEVYNFLGAKYAKIGRFKEAILLFNKAIIKNSTLIQAYINLSAAYGDAGEYQESIMAGKKVLKLNPDSAQAHYNLSVAYYFNKQYDLATKHLDTAINLGIKPDPRFLENLRKTHPER